MIKNIFLGIFLLVAFSCNKNEDNNLVKEGKGTLFLSGGYAFCAEQIRLDNKDTLVISLFEFDIRQLKSGDRVSVKYKEKGINEFCPPYIDCEVIELRKIK